MLSPNHFVSPFQSHFWPTRPIKQHALSSLTSGLKKSGDNLFASKEEKITNLMKINIIFKRQIELFYEFYCVQCFLSQRIVAVLQQLCEANKMASDDIPNHEQMIEGFLNVFVVPVYSALRQQQREMPVLSESDIKQQLEIDTYPMHVQREIEHLSHQMAILLHIACNELQLYDEDTVFQYVDEYRSVQHHELKLNAVGYKSYLRSLCHRYRAHLAIHGYVHEINAALKKKTPVSGNVIECIANNFYQPFGCNASHERIEELIFGPFNESCGNPIAMFVKQMLDSVMGTYAFLSTKETMPKFIDTTRAHHQVVADDDWD